MADFQLPAIHEVTRAAREPSGDISPRGEEEIESRMKEVFPAGYMTALAIIQGVALGFLLTTAQAQFLQHSTLRYRVMIGTQALAVFIIIVVVTHRYMTLTGLSRRRMLTGFDVFIPFVLGVAEMGSAQLIGYVTAWWCAILFFSCAGIGVYLHSRRRSNPETAYISTQFRKVTTRAMLLLASLGLWSAVAIIESTNGAGSGWFDALSPAVAVIVPLLIEFFGRYRFTALR